MKKFFSLILTVGILCSTTNVSAADVFSGNISSEKINSWDTPTNKYNKLHFYFMENEYSTIDTAEEMNNAFNSMNASSVFDITAGTETTTLNVTIQFASKFSDTKQYIELVNRRNELETLEDVHEWREELNSFSELYHNNLIDSNLSYLKDLEYVEYDPIKYSPFVVLKMDMASIHIDDFSNLIDNDNISHISFDYAPTFVTEMSWDDVLDTINATSIVENEQLTGDGVRIGILEAGGICDDTHDSLEGIDITYNDFSQLPANQTDEHPHATHVTAVLYSIAPNAEYFFNLTADSISLEWFIDNGCDIVNCSYGYSGATVAERISATEFIYEAATSNEYEMDKDGLYDYQIQNHFITVVKSAGNVSNDETDGSFNPRGLITNPGYAYNVITVGGIYENPNDESAIIHHPGACYVSEDIVKPNVSAPYIVDVPGIGICQGTSIAAPQVAASIALLYEENHRLSAYPEVAMAIVTASATETDDYYAENEDDEDFIYGFINEKVGTGFINVADMINIVAEDFYDTELNSEGELDEVFSISIDLNEGDILHVSATWIVRVSAEDNEPLDIHFTDYDLTLIIPDSNVHKSSSFGDESNVEFIRYEAEEDGEYTIELERFGSFEFGANDNDWLAIAYYIH